ncbi:2226_t:CDS:10, partial [Acaulospora colombiana]
DYWLISEYVKVFSPADDSIILTLMAISHAESRASEKYAVIDVKTGTQHSYRNLISDVTEFRKRLLRESGAVGEDLNEARIAFLCPSGYDYVVTQWSIWSTGGVAVPLSTAHPPPELLYFLRDSQASIVITHPEFYDRMRDVAKDAGIERVVVIGDKNQRYSDDDDEFRIDLYSMSGKPKGVVSTHANFAAQIKSLVEAWRYTEKDKLLHVLPLHHLHGILNVSSKFQCPGRGTVEMMPKFDAAKVWSRWMRPERDLTLFMAVPTIYCKPKNWIASLDHMHTKESFYFSKVNSILQNQHPPRKLMVSGSSALPVTIRDEWKEISGGQVLLERYGMSEIGMGLSHEYEVEKRYEGSVQVRLISEDGKDTTDVPEQLGELQIKGPNVFKEYWNRPDETKKEFSEDGWFKTGDVAIKTKNEKVFKIHGRLNIDIIKSGAYKISALEVEYALLSHSNISEAAVVGVEDHEWGQKVAALVALKDPA